MTNDDAISRTDAMAIAKHAFEPAHIYASENADTYRTFDAGQRRAIQNITAQLALLPALPSVPALASEGEKQILRDVLVLLAGQKFPTPEKGFTCWEDALSSLKRFMREQNHHLVSPTAEQMKAAMIEKLKSLGYSKIWTEKVITELQQVEVK